MAKYYYLMAQLPTISFGSKPPFKYEEFEELAFRYINKKDKEILKTLSLEPNRDDKKTSSSFLNKWYDFERAVRLALRELRASKLKWENVDISYEEHNKVISSYYAQNIASQAFAMDDPLQAELFLDRKRFEFLNNIKTEDAFSSDALFSYAIMLLLIIREESFSKEIGIEEYKKLYSEILEKSS
ncbi:MAG: DUF2764 family protein [Treponema sp.]